MQSGPAASTMASIANPFPIGFGCCKKTPNGKPRNSEMNKHYQINTRTKTNTKKQTWVRAWIDRERKKRADLHDGEGISGRGRLGEAELRGMVDFGDGLYRGCRSPWGVLLKRSGCSSFSGHTYYALRRIGLATISKGIVRECRGGGAGIVEAAWGWGWMKFLRFCGQIWLCAWEVCEGVLLSLTMPGALGCKMKLADLNST